MVVQAYILIQTDVGKAAEVAQRITDIKGVILAEDVTGPYDVIVRAEARNVDELGKLVVAKVQTLDGHHPNADVPRRPHLSTRSSRRPSPLGVAGVVVLATRCSPGCGAVHLHDNDVSAADRKACTALVDDLPHRVSERPRRETKGGDLGAAWGDPAIVLTLRRRHAGGLRAERRPCQRVNGVDWFVPGGPDRRPGQGRRADHHRPQAERRGRRTRRVPTARRRRWSTWPTPSRSTPRSSSPCS